EIRAAALDAATIPIPTAAAAVALRNAAETRFGDWVGTAAERRLANLGRQHALMSAAVDKLNIIASSDVFTDTDNEFNNTLGGFKADLRKLGQDIAAKWTGARDVSYLKAANAIEHRLAVAAVRISLLSVWRATIQVMSD